MACTLDEGVLGKRACQGRPGAKCVDPPVPEPDSGEQFLLGSGCQEVLAAARLRGPLDSSSGMGEQPDEVELVGDAVLEARKECHYAPRSSRT